MASESDEMVLDVINFDNLRTEFDKKSIGTIIDKRISKICPECNVNIKDGDDSCSKCGSTDLKVNYILFKMKKGSTIYWKGMKAIRIYRVPDIFTEFMDQDALRMHDDIMSGIWEAKIPFFYSIVGHGDLIHFIYGVTAKASGELSALEVMDRLDSRIQALVNVMVGSYPQIEYKHIDPEDLDMLVDAPKHYKVGCVTGIPTRKEESNLMRGSAIGSGGLSKGMEQVERLARGMIDSKFCYKVVAEPISKKTIKKAVDNVLDLITEYESNKEGTKGWTFAMGVPMMGVFNLGDSMSQSSQISETGGLTGSEALGATAGYNYSEGLSETENVSEGTTDTTTESHAIMRGETFGTTETTTNTVTDGNTNTDTQSLSDSTTTTYSNAETDGSSHTETDTSGRTWGQSSGETVGHTDTRTDGDSRGFSDSETESENSGGSWSSTGSETWSTGTSESSGGSSSHTDSSSQTAGYVVSFTNTDADTGGSSWGSGETDNWSSSQSETDGETWGSGYSSGHTDNYSSTTSDGYSDSTSRNLGSQSGGSRGHSIGDGTTRSDTSTAGGSGTSGFTRGSSSSDTHSESVGRSMGKTHNLSIRDTSTQGASQGVTRTTSEGVTQQTTAGMNKSESATSTQGWSQTAGQTAGITSAMNVSRGMSGGIVSTMSWSDMRKYINADNEFAGEMLRRVLDRYTEGVAQGMFMTNIYCVAPDEKVFTRMRALSRTAFGGEESLPEPIKFWVIDDPEINEEFNKHVNTCSIVEVERTDHFEGFGVDYLQFSTALNTREMTSFTHLPRIEIAGIEVAMEDIPMDFRVPETRAGEIMIGNVIDINTKRVTKNEWRIGLDELGHMILAGTTGSGKTCAALWLAWQFLKRGAGMLVLDWKRTWRKLLYLAKNPDDVYMFVLDDPKIAPLYWNLCRPPEGVDPEDWADNIAEMFCLAYGAYQRSRGIVWKLLYNLYEEKGTLAGKKSYPTIKEIYDIVVKRLETEWKTMTMGTRESLGVLQSRLAYFAKGRLKQMFGAVEYGIPIEELFKEDKIVVIEAGNLNGSNKKFIMGLLATALGEYRLKGNYASPAHILVMEECHELLPQEGKGSEAEKEMGVSESVFEKLFREIREFREYIWAIGQVISQLPAKVVANTPWQMLSKLLTEEDVKKATTIISRDPQYDHRRISRFIQRLRPGQFICRLPYGKSMAEQEPVIIKVPYIGNIPYPSDLEVHQHMQAKIQKLLDVGKMYYMDSADSTRVKDITDDWEHTFTLAKSEEPKIRSQEESEGVSERPTADSMTITKSPAKPTANSLVCENCSNQDFGPSEIYLDLVRKSPRKLVFIIDKVVIPCNKCNQVKTIRNPSPDVLSKISGYQENLRKELRVQLMHNMYCKSCNEYYKDEKVCPKHGNALVPKLVFVRGINQQFAASKLLNE